MCVFGFTDEEVRAMLSAYGLENHYEETRTWYDGYRFGGQDVYCPWDVINYCDDLLSNPRQKPRAYWMNTSGNDMVRRLIDRSTNGTTQMEIERLIAGETITKTLNEQLTHNEVDASIENIWSLLFMTGYLTAVDYPDGNRYELRIPNREVRQIYMQQVLSWFNHKVESETDKLTNLYAAFETGDVDTIKEILDEQLLDTVSFYDARESFYHGFLLALLSTCANWNVSSNIETGKGRSDIIAGRKDRKVGFVVEVKDVKDEEKLDAQNSESDFYRLRHPFRKPYFTLPKGHVYISNDWSALGRYLQRERRVYTLCEDTFGGTLDPDQHLLDEQRTNPRGPYRYWGDSPCCRTVESEDAARCSIFGVDKLVTVSKAQLLESLMEEEKALSLIHI